LFVFAGTSRNLCLLFCGVKIDKKGKREKKKEKRK
jgi:hypothetical protein